MFPTMEEVQNLVLNGIVQARDCPLLQADFAVEIPPGPVALCPETAALACYVLAPELLETCCPAATFSHAPTCSGNGCIPCLKGHVDLLRPDTAQRVRAMTNLWQRILAPNAEGASPLWGLLPGGFCVLDFEGAIPEGVIHGYLVTLAEIVLQLNGKHRAALSAYGRVRAPTEEARRLAQQRQLLLKVDLGDPTALFCMCYATEMAPTPMGYCFERR